MAEVEKNITISKSAYEKRWLVPMSDSLRDAYNAVLSRFVAHEQDSKYKDNFHQILTGKNGDKYYFDDFKYIYPITDSNDMEVLNSNRGAGEICKVSLYGRKDLIIENYNFRNNTATIQSAWINDATREVISSGFINNDVGYFLLQVSGGLKSCIDSLELCPKINISVYEGSLICRDEAGNVIDENPVKDELFYSNCVDSFNYVTTLSMQYSAGKGM